MWFWLVLITIVLTITSGVISHRIALHKEGDLVFWGILGFLTGPVGILITWALAGREWRKPSAPST